MASSVSERTGDAHSPSSGCFSSRRNPCLVPSPLLERKGGSRVPRLGVGWSWCRGAGGGSGTPPFCVFWRRPRCPLVPGQQDPRVALKDVGNASLSCARAFPAPRRRVGLSLRGVGRLCALAQTLQGSAVKRERVLSRSIICTAVLAKRSFGKPEFGGRAASGPPAPSQQLRL